MGFLSNLPRDLSSVWNRLPRGQKITLLFLGVTAIVLFVLFTSWSNTPDYVPLYSGLDPSDASAVVDRLQEQGIPHQIGDGGGTVRVPSTRAAEARLDLAAVGLPSGGGVGFEIFDRQSFGATDFVQQINLRRSLEGELTRTINQFDAVQGSRVHIAIPQEQLFSDFQAQSSASVVLSLHPGRTLSGAQVRGIAHLVAQSVDVLAVEQITILDTQGDILYDGGEDIAGGGNTQLELTQSFETQIERDLATFLRTVLGPNKSAVAVSAVLDFTRAETTRETFTPVEGASRSSQSVTETFSGSGTSADIAVPGAVANVPGLAEVGSTAPGDTSSSEYSRSESTTNSELNRTQEVISTAPGDVEQISISVLLDESIPDEEATSLQSAIATAAGMEADRGDTITVTRIAFDTTEIEEAKVAIAAAEAAAAQTNMLRLAIPVVAVVLAGGIFFFLLRKVSRAQAGQGYALAVDEGPAALGPGSEVANAMGALQAAEQRRQSEANQEVTTFARAQPKAVAEVVQTWMRED